MHAVFVYVYVDVRDTHTLPQGSLHLWHRNGEFQSPLINYRAHRGGPLAHQESDHQEALSDHCEPTDHAGALLELSGRPCGPSVETSVGALQCGPSAETSVGPTVRALCAFADAR